MKLKFEQVNPKSCKTYLAGRNDSREVMLIDPVLKHMSDYLEMLDRTKRELTLVIDTHTHADHISAGPALKDAVKCDYLMNSRSMVKCVTRRVTNGEAIEFGGETIRFLETPGHTQDSISLLFSDRILTGDTLFLDDAGAGRDDLPGGDPAEHWDSLQKILELPEELMVYPAHDYRMRNPSNLKRQKETNPLFRLKSKSDYVFYLEDLKLGPAMWMKDVLDANQACVQDHGAVWIPEDMPACEAQGTLDRACEQEVASLGPAELYKKLKAGDDILLLDVRESEELTGELGHLDGCRHLSVDRLSFRLDELEKYRTREIVTVCRSGGRAKTAALILMQAGFERVLLLQGGMNAWREQGLPTSTKKLAA